jgi:hypothetical protein
MIRIGIFPIGICGMGKSTYSRKLKEELEKRGEYVINIERDKIFGEFRKEGNSVRNAKKRLFEYYKQLKREIDKLSRNEYNRIWIIFDTSNLVRETREKSIELFDIRIVYSIYFSFPENRKGEMKEFLENRVLRRENHPTFPKEEGEKRETFNRLWDSFEKSLEYNNHFYEDNHHLKEVNEKIVLRYEKKNTINESYIYNEWIFQFRIM